MGRLKLFGEPEGGGTDDHSALSNLDYAHSGHSGFVPSQGVALIDILRLNQNVIRDSGGNDRITLSTASPHITLTNEVKVGTRLGLGAAPAPTTGLLCNPTISANNQNIAVIGMNPSLGLTGGTGLIFGLQGQALANVYSGATASLMAGLYFTTLAANVGTVQALYAIWARAGLMSYSGPAPSIWGMLIVRPWLYFSTAPTACVGVEIENQGTASSGSHNAIGLKIADQTGTSGNKYILDLGPATPYLRLLGGGDAPADKSNLYLKFGSTLYRVVKSGNYMTLEAA
jgi:hypothetical protein